MSTSTAGLSIDSMRILFADAGVTGVRFEIKPYPDEINVIAYVSIDDFGNAVQIASDVESKIQQAGEPPRFIIVRKAAPGDAQVNSEHRVDGVRDSRVTELVRLVSAKSRVSNVEPSLVYVPDARASLTTVSASRHHIVFGRRGAGKSALLMEARRAVVAEGVIDSWTNIQTLRREDPQRVFLFILDDVLQVLLSNRRHVSAESGAFLAVLEIREKVRRLLNEDETSMKDAQRIVPRAQRAIARFLDLEGSRVFVFIDDFYYVPRDTQPLILDMLHGAIRDANVWIKIASIRHLTNWWQAHPPTGLQSGQDADLIDLDVTLQNPETASSFLEGILAQYAKRVGIPSLNRVFNRPALDRLVLASGAVPRDYMVLAVSAINRALQRPKSKLVGVQDVNQAAGDAASAKIQELEEDMAANSGVAEQTLATLGTVRRFCLEETSFTYFLIGYRDKEENPALYSLLTDLMDVRLIHLVAAGVSDANQAGSRFEAYMLDLSQFSGSRLKQRINVLDFEDGKFVSKQTRIAGITQKGATARQLIGILRRAPELPIARLATSIR